jgi:DnaJ homologue, subfamily C, member 28, conserved domain
VTHPELWIDRLLRRAREQGAFDDLAGGGAPLDWEEENPLEDSAWRLAHHLLKEAGLAPPWMEEAKEIRQRVERLRHDLRGASQESEAEWQRAAARAMREIAAINAQIRSLNLAVPILPLQLAPLDAHEELQRARASTL